MTREEAKEKIFYQWQRFLEDNIDYAGISDAYKMAIKALEQEPCDDAISRQAGRMKAYTASRKSVKVIDSKPSANKSGSVTKK